MTGRELDMLFDGTGRISNFSEGHYTIYSGMGVAHQHFNLIHHCTAAGFRDNRVSEPRICILDTKNTATCSTCGVHTPPHIQALYHMLIWNAMAKDD